MRISDWSSDVCSSDLAGDLNNDPTDGDGRHEAIVELLEHPRVLRHATPRSEGAVEAAAAYVADIGHRGAAAHATGDFGDQVGTPRLEYLLPSTGLRPVARDLHWPASTHPASVLVTARRTPPVCGDDRGPLANPHP